MPFVTTCFSEVEDVMSDLRRESLNGKSSDRFAIQKELQDKVVKQGV